ncbi:PaaI family thioesterase [Amycolatopsis cynarae]|uniref:PaaI family thioesterase n=1 Tax=Amycolatopsis cynarae TaxID=2995223 RepID=A0ABY7AXI4_9PSEU|nr:PaaI family thioesterase [Amycolatopsis sp. HUAS 11-8]WAL63622.1 PaaI family thioesterase [Amycolatopsis sp. HUAS 11-8]
MTVEHAVRQKTISWQDPLPSAELARTMTGLDYLTAIAEGRIPGAPISSHLGMRVESVREGEVVFAASPDESLYNPIGTVHGGVAATMLDSAVACAVHSTLPAGVGYTSVELKINFIRAITTASGEIRARGRVVKSGSRIAFAEGELRDENDVLLATASSTCLVIQP